MVKLYGKIAAQALLSVFFAHARAGFRADPVEAAVVVCRARGGGGGW